MGHIYYHMLVIVLGITLLTFNFASIAEAGMSIEKEEFGTTPDGTVVDLYTLQNDTGMTVEVTNYEGIVVSLTLPDAQGTVDDIVLGYDTLQEYIENRPYFGGITNGSNERFDDVVWTAEEFKNSTGVGLLLQATLETGNGEFTGIVEAEVTYTLTNDNELRFDYTATTDARTVVNLSNQIYFNLAGAGSGDVLSHQLLIRGDSFFPLKDETFQPLGEIWRVQNTPMDFREPTIIGTRMNTQEDEQLRVGGGYNHRWLLNDYDGDLQLAARVYEPESQRVLELRTTQASVWFSTGIFVDEEIQGKGNSIYKSHPGFYLEPQHFEQDTESGAFGPPLLSPEEHYEETTIFKLFTM